MAKDKKIKVQFKERERVTPGSFNNIQKNLDKYEDEEIKQDEIQDSKIINEEDDLVDEDNLEETQQENKESEEETGDENNNINETQDNQNEAQDNMYRSENLSERTIEDSPEAQEENNDDSDDYTEEIEDTVSEKATQKYNAITEGINNVITKTRNTVLLFAKMLFNPITLVILILLFIVAYMTSVMLIVGQNDYNIMCDDMGVGSLMLDPDADAFTRQAAIASWLTSTPFEITGGQPLSREQAIGIMGNLIIESYGANPRAFQGDSSTTKWETCNNQCVLALGDVGGKAIGIIQWDRGRRQALVRFAISEGTEWHDLNTQLKFLKQEMDSGYEYDQLVAGGFNQTNKGVDEYVRIWNQYFERSRDAFGSGGTIRVNAAQSFANNYAGSGVSVAGGLANFCIGGMGGVDTTNLVQLAIASAWPDKEDSRGVCYDLSYTNCGQTYAMAAYKEIKLLAESNSTPDPIRGLLASCDRYVATMYKASGKDINMPWGGANIQGSYMRSSPKWRQVSCEDRQPGDVLWRDGHVMLYLGIVNGSDSIGSASLSNRTGAISGVRCSGSLFIGDGDTAIGFRMVSD